MEEANTALIVVLGALSVVSLGLIAATHRAVRRIMSRTVRPRGPTPAISVMRPLKGVDDGLYENLASMARQDYPEFEILLGVEDQDDPALDVARRLRREYPDVSISIAVCDRPIGLNPKVNILAFLSRRARHQHWLISDSNVRVGADYLRQMAAELGGPRVGLVTSVVAGTGEQSVGSAFENLHLASYVARATVAARVFLGRACVVGKSMLLQRREFESLGGWAAVRDVLAEDYVIGETYERAGFEVALAVDPVATVNERWSVERFMNRHLRWAQMRRRVSLPAFLVEPLFNPVPFLAGASVAALANAALIAPLAVAATLGGAALGMLAKIVSDARLATLLRGYPMAVGHLAWIPVKDLLVASLWVVAGLRRTVNWRGNIMRMGPGTRLERPATPRRGLDQRRVPA